MGFLSRFCLALYFQDICIVSEGKTLRRRPFEISTTPFVQHKATVQKASYLCQSKSRESITYFLIFIQKRSHQLKISSSFRILVFYCGKNNLFGKQAGIRNAGANFIKPRDVYTILFKVLRFGIKEYEGNIFFCLQFKLPLQRQRQKSVLVTQFSCN